MIELSTRQVSLQVCGKSVTYYVPADPQSKMQECWDRYGQNDQYFPFWLETWPSAFGLYDFILKKNIVLRNALEVGCGAGLFGQLISDYPGDIVHSDLVPDACRFARQHILSHRPVIAMDFTQPCLSKPFSLIVGSDLFYDDSLVEGLCHFMQSALTDDGVAWIADPQRAHRKDRTPELLKQSGLKIQAHAWTYDLDSKPQEIIIWQLQKASKNPLDEPER